MPYFLVNGVPCLNPIDVIAAMEKEGIPTDAVKKANTLTLQHGREPSTGYFLIQKKYFKKPYFEYSNNTDQVNNLNTTNIYIAITDYDPESKEYKFLYQGFNFYVTNAVNVLGDKNSDNSVLLVKVQDIRYWFNRVHCYPFLNFISSNNDHYFGYSATPNNFKQHNSVDFGTTYHSVENCIRILYNYFINGFYEPNRIGIPNDDDFDNTPGINCDVIYNDTDLDDYLHNLEFTEGTYLDAFCKICEASRLPFYIYTDTRLNPVSSQQFRFTFLLNSTPIEWPTQKPIHEHYDLADFMVPKMIGVSCLSEDYFRYNDLDTSRRPGHFTGSFRTYYVPEGEFENQSAIDIFVPHLIMREGDSVNVDESIAIKAHLLKIAKRYANLVSARTRSATWKGYLRLEDRISFGLDKIIYRDVGIGFTTTAVGTGIDEYDLNYTNPGYAANYRMPANMWLYRFKVVTQGYGVIVADLYTHDGNETPLTNVTIQDPLNVFIDLGTDDLGLCVRIPTLLGVEYYAIQAPCSSI